MKSGFIKSAPGSCLVEFGETKVLCAASIDDNLPAWRKGANKGWVSAEYSMLPASTPQRTRRETNGQHGRTHEIQRLIGRSLRAVVDLAAMSELMAVVDCDVLQADGGTRTAAICGAWVALHQAFETLRLSGRMKVNPMFGQVAAVSVGMVAGRMMLDLDYSEDSHAEIDMNIVMNERGELIEIQGTGERTTFDRKRLDAMLDMGQAGIERLLEYQREAVLA
jgi:ribonuclease PH